MLRIGAGQDKVEQRRQQQIGGQVEGEAVQRFEAENAGGNAEEKTRYGSDIGDCLFGNKKKRALVPHLVLSVAICTWGSFVVYTYSGIVGQ